MKAEILKLKSLAKQAENIADEIEEIIHQLDAETSIPIAPSLPKTNKVIYLNAGHGSNHPESGKYMTFPTHGKFYQFTDSKGKVIKEAREGVSNRIYAQMMNDIATRLGITVIKVYHDYLDRWNTERVSIANNHHKANSGKDALWFSWHSNAVGMASKGPSQSARGACIFTTRATTKSDTFATMFWKRYAEAVKNIPGIFLREDWTDGDADIEADFDELVATTMPAVLIENLFFTNLDDVALLENTRYMNAVASAIENFLMDWINA